MGFNDEYQKLRKKRLEGQNTDNESTAPTMLYQNKTLPKEDVAPIYTSTKKKQEDDDEDEKRTWFTKGAFDDGYQFGDVLKTVSGTIQDLSENISAGILGIGEKVVDAGAYLVGGAAGLLGADEFKEKTGEFIAKDLYDERELAKYINFLQGGINTGRIGNKILGVDLENYSLLGDKTDSLAQSGGQLLGTMGLQAIGVPWFVTSGTTSFGSAAEGALGEGATFGEAGFSAAIAAGAEILTEKLFGGSGLGEKGLINLGGLTKGISSKVVKSLADFGIDMAAEGSEEVISSVFSNLGSALYKEESLGELLLSEKAVDEYIESFIGGAALGGVMNTGKAANSIRTGTDYRTGLTTDESKVIDTIVDERIKEQTKDGAKVTRKQKEKIREQVMRDLERGYISVDDIERVLGGASYQAYRDMADTESAKQAEIQKQIEELENLPNEKITVKQAEQLKGLRQELQGLKDSAASPAWKDRVSESVMWRASGTRLAESYRETQRRGQAFQADLTQYDAKQQEVVKKAVESGILNNTNRTHEFVDMVARISADKGVLFDFVNNSKLKESGFAVDGATVNGYFDKKTNTVGVNIDSAKAFDTVVGHEITHVIEGTELYTELQKAVFDYAKTKGEYDGRREALAKLYAEEDINAEMTADLVGEYLFTDEDFVQSLSVQNRNVFQKIYDEIKYLYKVVTAGSKEARELERVKRAFDKAYKESGKASGTKYSLGYHAGDLGKAESYGQQGGYRDTGHFGTGTYFVGDESKISDGHYGKRPHHAVEFNNYNLYKVRSDKDGYDLHKQLKVIDSGVTQDFLDAVKAEKYRVSELRSEAWERGDKNQKPDVYDEELGFEVPPSDYTDVMIQAFTDVANSNGVEIQTYDEWLAEQSDDVPAQGNPDYDYYKSDYLGYLKDTLDEVDEARNKGYEDFSDAYFRLWLRFGKENVNNALQAVVDYDSVIREASSDDKYRADSRATVFMKALGYEGIDVRGTGLDNTTYGSVIYDLKGEDAQRKAEIGTAKYSLSDSDGKRLTKEQQEYFKGSKMRDENGNLKVMYHGSRDAGFHVFDPNMSDDDTSLFFVDRNDVAASYSGTTETYEARTIRSAEDMNEFLAEIGYDQYEAVERDGRFELLENNEHVAWSDTAQGLYEEFCWYEGVGEGDANYKVYLNLKNPLVVDAEGRNWDNVSSEFSQELADKYNSLTAEEKDALIDLAEWEDFSLFNSEIQEATEGDLASAYAKMGEDCNIYDLFSVAADNFSEESMRENARGYLKTRDYAQRAKEQGYDGVIFNNIVDNGGYSNGSEGASTVAIAFDSSQIKSVANENPTGDPDIRYSLSKDSEGRQLTDAQKAKFKGSKVVDDNGNLKVVYHGSPADFNTFSLEYLGTNGTAEGYGFYFTDSKRIADGYSQRGQNPGKLFEVYLDIKKPLSDTKVTMTKAQFKKFLTELNKQVDADGERLDILTNYGDVEWEGLNNVLNYAMELEYDGNDTDVDIVHSIINSCGNMEVVFDVLRKVTGYDGIIVKEAEWGGDQTIYVAFHPEQIKNVDNLNPTDDPDTRYHRSAEGEAPGKGRFYGKDIRLEFAPVAEDVSTTTEQAAPEAVAPGEIVSETETIAPVNDWMPEPEETYAPSLYDLRDERDALREQMIAVQDDLDAVAPLAQRYGEVMQQIQQLEADERDRLASLDDADVPPEVEAPYYESEPQAVTLDKAAAESVAKGVEEMLYINDKKQSAKLGEVVQRYSEHQSREQLVAELKENFGTITETYTDDHLAEVKSFLRTYRLSVSDHIKSDYENFNETRKHFFGKLRITKNGVPVDSAYMELSEMFPQYFPEDIDNEFEQFERILDVADTLSTFEKEIGELGEEEIYAVADKIIGDIQGLGRAQNEKAAEAYFSDLASSFAANEQYMPMAEDIAPLKNNKIEIEVEPIEDAKPIKTVKDRIEGKLRNSEAELSRNERLQRESAASFNEKIASIRAEYNAKANKDTKVANNLLRRIERLQRLRDDVDADYAKRINDNRAKVDKYKAQMEQGFGDSESREMRADLHHGIVDGVKKQFADEGFDFDRVLKNARNLSTFATVDNTPQRVMEKALGYKEGQILADLTVNKVAQNETEGIKWLNSYTDRKSGLLAQISKQYHIKPGSKESAAAQMYAEGFFVGENGETITYSDAELAKDFPDARTQENIKGLAGDPRIRQIYDETLAMINESRARNAYPEIQKLDNYFLHFRAMDDTFSRIGLPFNPNDIKAKDLPTDLNGVTADLKPGQPYFASSMHRRGNRTSYDLLGGLERYLTGAKGQIYHIDDIQTLRALRNYIADTYGQANGLESLDELTEEEAQERIKQVYGAHLSTFAKFLNEEANVIAGKTALIDRGLEGIIGRRGMTFMDTINKQVGSNMVGFNVSSSLTNFLPVVQAFAKTNKYAFVKGFAQTVSNRVGSIAGKGDGFAENSPVMIRREGADRFYRTPFQKVGDAGYTLMGAVDSISTEIIARAKFNELTRKGMSETQAHYETDKWVSRLMGDRSLGQMPQLYNSKMLGLVTKFQLEVRNQLDSQFYDTIQEAKVSNEHIENQLARNAKTAAKVASTFFQLAVAQHLFGAAFESIAGYNPAFDIIEVIMTALGWDDDEESEDTALDNVEQAFLALLEDLPYTSTFTGGRIPISSALPIEQLIKGEDEYGNEKSRLETLGEIAPYYVLPGGYGQIKKSAQGLGMFSDKLPVTGSYTDSGNLRFPVEKTPGNIAQAAVFGQWASDNARYYFDNDIAPLNEKQTQEYADVGMSIRDYWKYRKGLSGLKTLEEKAEYIDSLDLTDEQKNILINNIADREEDIDMSDYDQYGSFGEFDFAAKNPEKYEFFKANGISYEDYESADEDGKRAYTWAYENPEKYTVAKAISDDFLTYYKYKGELYDIKADKDENGESIRGSAKDKKIDYINNLDLDYGQRIILFKSLYNADDTYNADIVDYLNGREDISYDEMVTILTELGFTVKNGNVYWD